MLRHSLFQFIRQFQRDRLFSFINILGLSVGICSSLLIYLYIQEERSYDRFHQHHERIYRINQTFIWGESNNLFASTGAGVASALASEIPEFEEVTRIHTPGDFLITYENSAQDQISYDESGILAVDSNFFRVFTFPLIFGNSTTALGDPNSLVLTQETAIKYFKDPSRAVGEILKVRFGGEDRSFVVTGVAEDVPSNSYLDFDMLMSMSSIPGVAKRNWSWIWTAFVTFVKTTPSTSSDILEAKLRPIPAKYAESTLQRLMGISFEEYQSGGKEWNLSLQPLTSIHLHSNHIYNRLNRVGNIKIIWALAGAAVFIIILSCINFMNLSTCQYTGRAKSNAVRRILGSTRKQLIFDQMLTTSLYCLTALVVGILLTDMLLPYFNQLSGSELHLSFLDPTLLGVLFSLLIVIVLFSGSYPSFFLSAFSATEAMRGQVKTGRSGQGIRNALVLVQFTVSILLVICTSVVSKQLQFMANKDLGFDKENLMVIDRVEWTKAPKEFVDHLAGMSQVNGASYSSSVPPRVYDGDQFQPGDQETKSVALNYVKADENYLPTIGLELLEGRNFRPGDLDDANKIILNQKAVEAMGWQMDNEVIGKKVVYPGTQDFEVIGVVRDFNYWSLHAAIEPFALFSMDAGIFSNPTQFVMVRLGPMDQPKWTETLSAIQASWRDFAGDLPFSYQFVDQAFETSLEDGAYFESVLTFFTALSIFIAALGLLGLVVFTLEQRTKEIGIRKVLGAGLADIFRLISWNYARLLLVSFVLSVPLAIWAMGSWLSDYEYRIDLSPTTFLVVGLGSALVALTITGMYSIRASRVDPVESLRDE